MSATTIAYWPGITDEQIDAQLPFSDDGYAWAEWSAAIEGAPDVARALTGLGAGALLTVTTPDMDDEDVDWATPRELREAAVILRDAIADDRPGTQLIVAHYGRHAGGEVAAAEGLCATLAELTNLVRYAEEQGAARVTLQVSW